VLAVLAEQVVQAILVLVEVLVHPEELEVMHCMLLEPQPLLIMVP
jgi:hypothetical protein